MLSRIDVEKVTSAYYEVEQILANHKDVYLTKEEIYARMTKDSEGVCLYTISKLETTLRDLCHRGQIKVAYVRGTRYFGYQEEKKGW
jgi:Fe2+ or Zn2+ uptake regulation protein